MFTWSAHCRIHESLPLENVGASGSFDNIKATAVDYAREYGECLIRHRESGFVYRLRDEGGEVKIYPFAR